MTTEFRTLTATAMMAMLLGVPALAQTSTTTGGVGMTPDFSSLDTDSSGDLSEDELGSGLFTMLDADGDGMITQAEFIAAMGDQDFATWDTDVSGDLSEDEFSTGMTTAGTFTDWDSDASGTVSETEFDTGSASMSGGMESGSSGSGMGSTGGSSTSGGSTGTDGTQSGAGSSGN